MLTAMAEDMNGATGTATVTVRISRESPAALADLSAYWLAGDSAFSPGAVTRTLVVGNGGPDDAASASLALTLTPVAPGSGATIRSIQPPPGWQCTGATCEGSDLGADTQVAFEVEVSLTSGEFQLTGALSSGTDDPLTVNDEAFFFLRQEPDQSLIFASSFE